MRAIFILCWIIILLLCCQKKIKVTAEAGLSASLSAADKKKGHDFYDEYGWKEAGNNRSYNDTVAFEDRRPVSQRYLSCCHLRLNILKAGNTSYLMLHQGLFLLRKILLYRKVTGCAFAWTFLYWQ